MGIESTSEEGSGGSSSSASTASISSWITLRKLDCPVESATLASHVEASCAVSTSVVGSDLQAWLGLKASLMAQLLVALASESGGQSH
jgi:hypothetical protein